MCYHLVEKENKEYFVQLETEQLNEAVWPFVGVFPTFIQCPVISLIDFPSSVVKFHL